MTYLDGVNKRFLDHLRADVDVSVGLGLPDHFHRLGDPSLEAHWRSVDDARALLDDVDESRAGDFHERLDLQLIRRHLQQDLFFKTLENHGELQRRRKPGGVDGVSEGIFQLFVNDERDSGSRLADILSRLEGVQWVMCMGTYNDGLILAVRSRSRRAGAGQLVQAVVGDLGMAGGHGTMAGGHVPLHGADPALMAERLGQKMLAYLKVPPTTPSVALTA
jgi:hypothetical protein